MSKKQKHWCPRHHPAQLTLIHALADALDACRDLMHAPPETVPGYIQLDAKGMEYMLEIFFGAIDVQTSPHPQVQARWHLLERREARRAARAAS